MLPHKRHSNYLAQKKMFLIVSEGRNTEREYFGKIIGDLVAEHVYVRCLPGKNGSSPDKLLERLVGFRDAIHAADEQWAVADCDCWTTEQRQSLLDWAAARRPSQPFRGVVFSSPMFELWLLLHFRDVASDESPGTILNSLKHFLPSFSKKADSLLENASAFTLESIRNAIARAKTSCLDGQPRIASNTTNAWALVERILRAGHL